MQQQRQQQGRRSVGTADVSRPVRNSMQSANTAGSGGSRDSSAALRRSRSCPSQEFLNRRARQSETRSARQSRPITPARAAAADSQDLLGNGAVCPASPPHRANSQQRLSVLCGVASPDIAAGAVLPAPPMQPDRSSGEGAAATASGVTSPVAVQLPGDRQQQPMIPRQSSDVVLASALPRPVVRPPADWDCNVESATRRVRDSISPGGASLGPRLRTAAIIPDLLTSARPRTTEPVFSGTARSSPRRGSFGSAIPRPRMR